MKLSIDILKTLISNSALDYRKKNITGQCPYCGGMEFGIAIADNHRFGCFRKAQCGETGNIFKLLKKLGRTDLFSSPENVQISSFGHLENIIDQKEEYHLDSPEIQLPIGFRRLMNHSYLDKRGFTEEDYRSYEVGITNLDSKLKDRIIFLIRQKHKLVATVARSIKTKEEIKQIEKRIEKRYPRYVNSATDFENLLLGIDECTVQTNTVILVEGIFGKRNVDKILRLRNQEEIKCLCSFGAKLSPTQILLLHIAGIENIILFFDPDVLHYVKKYSSRLADEFDSVRVALITEIDKDPADLSEEKMVDILNNLKNVIDVQLNVVQILDLK